MKYLENSKIDELVSRLSRRTVDCYLETKLESYSCKLVTREKRLFKAISNETGRGPNDLQALSPSNNFLACSPTRIRQRSSSDESEIQCDVISTKTLFYLTATLNESFRDYDFTSASSHDFSKENNVSNMINSIDCRLMLSVGEEYSAVKPLLWNTINEEICIKDCDVYSYIPDSSSDPYSECLWSFNYFFYNRKLKRVLFFTCMAKSFSVVEENKSVALAEEDWLTYEMDE